MVINKTIEIKMKRNIYILLFCIALMPVLVSCELFGLKLQQDYEYVATPPNNVFDLTAYEFIEKRKNIDMRLYFEAINFCEMKKEYETHDRTYVVFKDKALASFLESYKYYDVQNADKTILTNLLGQYIGLQSYGVLNLPSYALSVSSLYEKAPLYIGLLPTSQSQVNPYQVVLNNYPGTRRTTWVTTSNIKVKNGYIYVVETMPLVVM